VPFFSRRIGLSENGTPIPIVGGARMSGRASDYDVGVMTMTTEEFGPLPSDTFLVGRARRNLPNTSTVGAIFTSKNAEGPSNSSQVFGVDSLLRFFDQRLDVASYLWPAGPGAL
jgi:hypothetical protein